MGNREDTYTLENCEVLHDGDRATKVRYVDEDEMSAELWIPNSTIRKIERSARLSMADKVTMDRWIARQKGLCE